MYDSQHYCGAGPDQYGPRTPHCTRAPCPQTAAIRGPLHSSQSAALLVGSIGADCRHDSLAATAAAHMGTVFIIFGVVGAAAPLTSLFIVLHTPQRGSMEGES